MKQTTTFRSYCSAGMVILATLFSLPASAHDEGETNKPTSEEEITSATTVDTAVPFEELFEDRPYYYSTKKKREKKFFGINVHTNLLHWAALTPNIGLDYKFFGKIELVVDADFAPWQWKDECYGYKVWNIQPQLRYYFNDRWYGGAEMHYGELRWKLKRQGTQGNYKGSGFVGGYKMPVGKSGKFDLDFNIGIGYTFYQYDTYQNAEGYLTPIDTGLYKDYIGITSAGVTLIYKW